VYRAFICGNAPTMTRWLCAALTDIVSLEANHPDVIRLFCANSEARPGVKSFRIDLHLTQPSLTEPKPNRIDQSECNRAVHSGEVTALTWPMPGPYREGIPDLLTEMFNAWLSLNVPSNLTVERILPELEKLSEIFTQV
jgi:hypothetical protein